LREVTIFPWGTSYAFKLGSVADPADAREVGFSPFETSRINRTVWMPSRDPGNSRCLNPRGSALLFASPASAETISAHLWTDAFSASRMRTPRAPFWKSLWSLDRHVPTSDALFVTRRHVRVGSSRPIRSPCHVLGLRLVHDTGFYLRVRTFVSPAP
jgi:hypothetical protein